MTDHKVTASAATLATIKEALETENVLWQRGDESILTTPDPNVMLKVYKGPSGQESVEHELNTEVSEESIDRLPKLGKLGLLPIPPVQNEEGLCLLIGALPQGGVILRPAGRNDDSKLDQIAELIAQTIDPEAVEDCFVYNLTDDTPSVCLLSLKHFNPA